MCPLCARAADPIAANALAVAFFDAFPLNPGHALIIPRRHVADLFELMPDELAAVWELLPEVKGIIDRDFAPQGYNIGVNVGRAAGQTVSHAHVHVIPRIAGDVADPRGGMRWIIPQRAAYWSTR